MQEDLGPVDPCHCDLGYGKKQENKTRGNWLHTSHGTLALIGASISLSSFWRFPYLIYKDGPGYLAVYTVYLLLLGLPLAYYELSLGQFSSSGVLDCWPVPMFKGVGAAMLVCIIPSVIHYQVFSAHSILYLHATISSSVQNTSLPWTSQEVAKNLFDECGGAPWLRIRDHLPSMNLSNCVGSYEHDEVYPANGVCFSTTYYDHAVGIYNASEALYLYQVNDSTWDPRLRQVVNDNSGKSFYDCATGEMSLSDDPVIKGHIVICLLIAWILVFLAVMFGVKSIGIVKMFSVPLTVILIIVLAVYVVRLPGASHGLKFAFTFERLHYEVYQNAAISMFYSLGVGSGILITYSSYNRFHNNFVRDLLIYSLADYFTKIMFTVIVCSLTGFIAHQKNIAFNHVASGPDLAFASFPVAFAEYFPNGRVMCGILFLLLFLLSFNPAVASTEVIMTGILDAIPTQRLRKWRHLFALAVCILLFLLGLPSCTTHSSYWMTFVDWTIYAYTFPIIIILMVLCYVFYGVLTYFWHRHDVAAMTGYDLCCLRSIIIWMGASCSLFLLGSWIILGSFLYGLISPVSVFGKELPSYFTRGFEICFQVFPVVVLVITFLIQILVAVFYKKGGGVKSLFRVGWKPALKRHEDLVNHYRATNPHRTQNYSALHTTEEGNNLTAPTEHAQYVRI